MTTTDGGNSLEYIANADDALAFVSAITVLRDEIAGLEGQYKPHLDELAEAAKAYRAQRDEQTKGYAERMQHLREALTGWLQDDPDGQLRDGGRIVATLAASKPQVHINDASLVPAEYCSPDAGKIAAAFKLGRKVPGAAIVQPKILKVL